jgi:hypothetical protein
MIAMLTRFVIGFGFIEETSRASRKLANCLKEAYGKNSEVW